MRSLQTFFQFAGKYKKKFKIGIFFSLLNSLFQGLQIFALFVVLKALVENNLTPSTAYTSLGIMLISVIGGVFTTDKAQRSEYYASFDMCADKRIAIGERMKYMPMGFFSKNNLGEITAALTTTMSDIQNIAGAVVEKTVHGIIHALIVTLFILIFDYRIGLIILGGIGIFYLINVAMQKKSDKISANRVKAQTKLVGAVLEYILGMSVVKAYNMDADANKAINKTIKECEKQNFGLELAFFPYMMFQGLALKMTSAIIIITSIALYLGQVMPLHNCLLIVVASFIIFGELEVGGNMSALLRMVDVGIKKVEEINQSPIMDEHGTKITPDNLSIEAKNISFSYSDRKIIDDISFSIPFGSTTAIVGPSGGGKTTVCKLIARFWDVDKGAIKLGGKDIKDYKLDSLLSNISIVFQDVYLFNDTIENNIKFGNSLATIAQVVSAAKEAQCHDFISALPNGYETLIGEAGATISGGEKQRISIARAILKGASIVILDEATANVDPENEELLQMAIKRLTQDKTVIMIAHRIRTVMHADQILVIDKGKVAQRGTHDQLENIDGIYKDFIDVKNKAIGWKL